MILTTRSLSCYFFLKAETLHTNACMHSFSQIMSIILSYYMQLHFIWKHNSILSGVTLPFSFSGSCPKGKWRLHRLLRFRFLWHVCMQVNGNTPGGSRAEISTQTEIWQVLVICSDSMTKHVTWVTALQLYCYLPSCQISNWHNNCIATWRPLVLYVHAKQ